MYACTHISLELLARDGGERVRVVGGFAFGCRWLGGYHGTFDCDTGDSSRAVHVRGVVCRGGAVVSDVRREGREVALAVAHGGEGVNNEERTLN